MKIIFVCTGNTCRSPMAEGFAVSYLKDKKDIVVISRGLSVIPGSKVSIHSVNALKDYDINISEHIPTQLTADDIADSDYVFTMTGSQAFALKSVIPQFADKIFSVSEFTSLPDVSDPYGQGSEKYKKCAKDIKTVVINICEKIDYE